MRHLALLAAVLVERVGMLVGLELAADANSVKTFDVDASGDVGEVPDPEPALPEGGRSLEAVIIDAPPSVAPNERFDFVVELRNPMMEPIDLSPCPWFHAVFGESGIVTNCRRRTSMRRPRADRSPAAGFGSASR